MRFSQNFISEVIENNSMFEVASEYISLKKNNKNYSALCPFHNEKTPSFMVSEEKQMFHCFGCGVGGNVIHFIMKQENLNFIEAIKFLSIRANIDIPSSEEFIENENHRNILFAINEEASIFFLNTLKNSNDERVKKYIKKRNITESDIENFKIGYASKGKQLFTHLIKIGYSEEMILEVGLSVSTRNGIYDFFQDMLIFPIFNKWKKIVGFGGRTLEDTKEPKYKNTAENQIFKKSNNLFGTENLGKIKTHSPLILVEGYMDVISLARAGFRALGCLGTNFSSVQASILKKFDEEIYLCLDNDSAGFTAEKKIASILLSLDIEIKVIKFDDVKDPDEFLNKFGKNAFDELIRNSPSFIDYSIKCLEEFFVNNKGKEPNYIKKLINFFSSIPNDITKEVYSKKISEHFSISIETVLKYIGVKNEKVSINKCLREGFLNKNIQNNYKEKKEINRKNEIITSEKILLTFMEHHFKLIASEINEECFITQKNKSIFLKIFNSHVNNSKTIMLLNEVDEEEKNEISKIIYESEEILSDCENEIKQCIKTLKLNLLGYKVKMAIEINDKEKIVKLMRVIREIGV